MVLIRYYKHMKKKQIYDYLERLSNLLRNEVRRAGAEYGLQPVQVEALHYLSICNRYSDTPMAVTEYLGQTKGTVSQSLKVLEKKGFLSKRADKNDKRMIHLKLTGAAKKLLKKTIPTPLFSHACEHLDEQSQIRITNGLTDILQVIQRSNGMRSFGVCHTCRYNKKNKDGSNLCNLTQESLSQTELQLICREHESVA